jgi:hypothetical protein
LSEISLEHTHAVAGTVTGGKKTFIHEMNGNSSSSIFSILFKVCNLRPRFRVQKEEGEKKTRRKHEKKK